MIKLNLSKLKPHLIEIILLVVFFVVSMFLRTGLPHAAVFSGGWIKFTTPDAYYFMRQVDSMVANFPHHIAFDPYLNYPSGASYTAPNMFVYLLSAIIWVIGLGSPSQHLLNLIAVYYPAILAALIIIPVYFIGKTLFNRWAGIIGAGLIAILPGEFLGRTILGVTDRDAFEALLTALTMLFFILAFKSARSKKLTFASLRNPLAVKGPIIYTLITGILLGIFLLTWRGAFLMVIIILACFVVQSLVDRLRHASSEDLSLVCGVIFLIGAIMFLPVSPSHLYSISLAGSLLVVIILSALNWWQARAGWKPVYYPATMVGLALVGLGLFYAASPGAFRSIWDLFASVFFPSRAMETVSEVQSILFPGGQFTLAVVWGNYTFAAFFSLIALGLLIYREVKNHNEGNMPLIVWSVVMLFGTLDLRRLALLFAINVAVLTGYLGWRTLKLLGLQSAAPSAAPPVMTGKPIKAEKTARSRKRKQKKVEPAGFKAPARLVPLSFGVAIIFLLGFLPNFFYIGDAVAVANSPDFTPPNSWHQALNWLKNNSPEPFGSADFYYQLYPQNFSYPSSAYTVVAWWDYGYWISRIAQRRPADDPGGGARQQVAQLFLAQDQTTADNIANSLDAKYIVLDQDTFTQKFGGIMTYAGISSPPFGVYYQNVNGTLQPVLYYYPQFYQAFSVDLFYYNGQAYTPQSVTVISYANEVSQNGIAYQQVLNSQSFSTYADAQSYIAGQKTGNYRIVGTDPAKSPVPLPALTDYKLVYSTLQGTGSSQAQTAQVTPVKIFEYQK